ncbi:transcription initiation factor TFIID subunit 8-like [Impatiens glandulifera]|uniref:transcription initiation factor TFIID subunit 8-like n=1 Tax=Impatiens glandulifera TaxID=253017 RepID=UPI001FB04D97|nr:transcription initiation factor TFIID subunit 8-like [Impatiens glandulifera]
MSDGDKVVSVTNDSKGEEIASLRINANDYSRAVSKIAIAQLCDSIGFQGYRESALEALEDVAIRYILDLGKTSKFYANVSGRTDCNVVDIVQGLEDLSSSTGFTGASEIGHSFANSGMLKEIIDYVETVDEIPFAQPLQRFPISRSCRTAPSFEQLGEIPVSKHIPSWLPAFPDQHTYKSTPIWSERQTDPREDKIELARQRRKAERSFLSLQQRLVTASKNEDETNNMFLAAPPIEDEERNGVGDDLRNVSALNMFIPAIEAISGGEICESESRCLPNVKIRQPVKLKIKMGEKILGKSVDLSIQKKKGLAKMGGWFPRDDEKDDKKRRAELILRQSMENRQELTQL